MRSKIISRQAGDIYKLLKSNTELSAKDIAQRLDILPNAVYRAIKQLLELGIVEKVDIYPATFKAVPATSALNWYLFAANQNFKREFNIKSSQIMDTDQSPRIALIKNRQYLLQREDTDVRAATHSVDFIVSGLEVPHSTVLAYRKAAATGVSIRAIVQQKRETSQERLERWQNLGAAVKYLPNLNMRLIVIDQRITYITSYDPSQRNRAFGVRFDYAPLAIQMGGLFEQHWQKAEELH